MLRRSIDEYWLLLLNQQFNALTALRETRLPGPFLTIYFSTIDIYSSIWSGEEVDGIRYKQFCDKYIIKHLPALTTTELWSARCSIIHSASSESRLSKKGKAREFLYSWGPSGKHATLDKIIPGLTNPEKYVAVSFEQLEDALHKGITEFAEDLSKDSTLAAGCMLRLTKTYTAIPAPPSSQ